MGVSEEEYALFCLLQRDDLSKSDRERLKAGSRGLLKSLQALLAPLEQWTRKEQTQAEVEVFILDELYRNLPDPPFTSDDKSQAARKVYNFIWQQSEKGWF